MSEDDLKEATEKMQKLTDKMVEKVDKAVGREDKGNHDSLIHISEYRGRRDSCLLFYVMGRGTAGWRQLHMNGRTGRMFQEKCGRTCREVRQKRLRITEGPVGKYGRNRLRSTDGPVRKYGRNG